eukprot:jgi/Mesen1/2603/ME000166S01727
MSFGHGQSNPTFLLEAGKAQYVLRKKPPGKLLKSAHAIEREFQVLAALGQHSDVPVPRVHCLCSDASVIGTPFYVMEYVKGRIFTDPSLPGVSEGERRELYRAMAHTLAALHRVDVARAGLASFGRRDHYCRRQVDRWAQQYAASTGSAGGGPEPSAAMLQVTEWLRAHVPPEDDDAAAPVAGLVHGDFRLDNLVFHPRQARVVAVLDWELATLGNQMSDLAYCCMPYLLPSGSPLLPALRTPAGAVPRGIPSEADFVADYCQATGVAWPAGTWQFYMALSLFRAAAIFAGVYRRALQGNASSRHAASTGEMVSTLSALALSVIHDGAASLPPQPAVALSSFSQTPTVGSSAGVPAACTCQAGVARNGRPLSGGGGSSDVGTACACGAAAEVAAANGCQCKGRGCQGCGARRGGGQAAAAGQGEGQGQGDTVVVGLAPTAKVRALRARVEAFMREHVYAAETVLEEHAQADGGRRWSVHPLVERLKGLAQQQGLWNLWIPADSAALAQKVLQEGQVGVPNLVGAGLSNLEYAHVCEPMGTSAWAPELFNCSAPDTGNMEVLLRYGSAQQQRTWLLPLLQGTIRSCFAMTEPAVASSDATNIEASITREGEEYVVTGRKWWTSGAMDPRCAVAIFMGKSDPSAAPHRHALSSSPLPPLAPKGGMQLASQLAAGQQSMVLVDMKAPGVKVLRPLTVYGSDDAPHGHAEVLFDRVRVPVSNLLLGEGRGFEIAQGRLGPGRLHHCMRLIGAAERGLQAMTERSLQRTAFGRPLARHGAVAQQVAECRVAIEGARLLVLQAAHDLDRLGNKKARNAIAIAKVVAPRAALQVLDAAIQVHGGAGVCSDFPLARLWIAARTLRIADGPDEVHLGTIARAELQRSRL